MKGFSRKAQRKQERKEKKQKKNLYFQRKNGLPDDAAFTSRSNNNNKPKVDIAESTSVERTKRKRKRKNSDNSKLARIDVKREQRFIREEERTIKKYEKLLKLKSYTKRNKLPKSFYYDGLGELLELCEGKQYSNRVAVDGEEEGKTEDPFDQLRNRGRVETKVQQREEDSEEDDNDSEFGDEEMDDASGDDDGDSSEEGEEMAEMDDADEDWGGFASDVDEKETEEATKPRKAKKSKKDEGPRYHEDIYGFLRDKDGNIVKDESHRHAKEDFLNSHVVVDETLQRKIRGLLNRLTAENIKVISKEILSLYKGTSRAVINRGILNCLEKVIIDIDYSVPVKLVSEMAMLVAILHTEMGEEVGAFFIHSAIRQFDRHFSEPTRWNTSKRLNNTVVLILNLYATGLVDSAIVYDILDKFCDQFAEEKSIEMIDLMLKASGFMLRKDDATRMKSLIVRIQQLSSSVDQSGLSGTRIKFILESLTAIKNNNIAKLKVTDPVVMGELIESTLKGVIKKSRVPFIPGQYATVIQSAHWFSYTATIVPLEAMNAQEKETKERATSTLNALAEAKIDYQLRDELCKKLRINTPLRKDLFTALFACNDYLDASCKLISIGKKQFSEVVNVVLHVAVNEKQYNQFYYHLLQHLTTCDRKYKLALDFAVRDKIAEVENMSVARRTTFAKLLFNLLKGGAVAITCLKVVQFSDMNEVYVDFIRKILEPLFSQCDDTTMESILAKIPKKDGFAGAIKLFITCFMSADSKNRMSSVKQLQFKLKI